MKRGNKPYSVTFESLVMRLVKQFSPVTSSDEDVNILTTCFCFIFISSGSGCCGFTYMEIDRSVNRSVVIIAP